MSVTAWSATLALVPTPKCFMISYLWDFTGFMENFGMVPNPWGGVRRSNPSIRDVDA